MIVCGDILSLIFTEILIEPNTNFTLFINHNLSLGNIESTNLGEELLVTIQHGHGAVEVVGVGDIFIIAESGSTMLQVHVQHVGGPTELLHHFGLIVQHPHNVILVAAVLNRFNVFLVLFFVRKVKRISVQELPGLLVPNHHDLISIIVGMRVGDLLPLF